MCLDVYQRLGNVVTLLQQMCSACPVEAICPAEPTTLARCAIREHIPGTCAALEDRADGSPLSTDVSVKRATCAPPNYDCATNFSQLALLDPPCVVRFDRVSEDFGVIADDAGHTVVLWATDGEIDAVVRKGARWVLRDGRHALTIASHAQHAAAAVFASWKKHNPEIAS